MRIPATVLLALLCLTLQAQDYVRVTRAEDITEDAEYIIGAMGNLYHNFYLMAGSPKDGFSPALLYGETVPDALPADCGAEAWTVCYSSNSIALYHPSQQFLSLKNDKVALGVTPTFWAISALDDGTFVLTYNGKALRLYYRDSGSRFGYYSTESIDRSIVLYKRSTPHSQWTTYRRHLTSERWETLCLPFATTVPAGVEAIIAEQRLDSEISYSPATYIPAGTPCLIRSKGSTVVTLQSDGTTVTSPNAHTPLRGTFTPLHPTGYALDGTAFAPLASGALIPAFRAYLPQ